MADDALCVSFNSESKIKNISFNLGKGSSLVVSDDVILSFELSDGSRLYVSKDKAEKVRLSERVIYDVHKDDRSGLFSRYELMISRMVSGDGVITDCSKSLRNFKCLSNESIINDDHI